MVKEEMEKRNDNVEKLQEDATPEQAKEASSTSNPNREGITVKEAATKMKVAIREKDKNSKAVEDRNVKFNIQDVDLYYGDFQALYNNNMQILEGEVTAFIGPSGSGKSTLLKTLNRMNDLVDGCRVEGLIELDGQDIYGDRYNINELRKNVGMVFQQPNPFPKSIYDNIAYGPRTHGIKDSNELDHIVEDSLKKAAIWDEVKDHLDRNALSISGGQQQRVCIARALAVEPDVLLMDEPTSALDPLSTSKIEDLVEELKQEFTIVIVTHNMQQASRISDKTAYFLSGELIEVGETEQIFTNPQHEETENYVSGRFG